MKKLVKQTLIITVALILVLAFPMSLTAYAGCQCAESGCDRKTDSGIYCRLHKCGYTGCHDRKGDNGSIYCNYHAREKLGNSSSYKNSCITSGCYRSKAKDSSYCSVHKCKYTKCTSKVTNEGYCYTHWKESNANTKKSYTPSRKTTSSKSSTKQKKYEMPDCDDYENLDDFLDDWDGCMPDGSDAEDYWYNW